MREPDEREEPETSPYLRRSKRVEVRRAVRWKRILLVGGGIALVSGGTLAAAAHAIDSYLKSSPRFTLTESLEFSGGAHVSREQLARVFVKDVGRSVFAVPIEKRRRELMALPWVDRAHVVRSWPNRLRVLVNERKPVAFVRMRSVPLCLIDREGALLPIPRRGKFPFPVLTGVSDSQEPGERKKRVARML